MSPHDRYVILRQGRPVWTTNTRELLVPFLWGCDVREQYVVLDYERPFPVETADLWAWLDRLPRE